MDTIRDLAVTYAPTSLALGGLMIGLVFGLIVFSTNFCAMGSISDVMIFGDYRRFRAWLLAGAVAILGVQLLQFTGIVDVGLAMFVSPNVSWLANIIGGLLFGFGMVLSGGCVSRNLVRVGTGDLRSLFILMVVGLFAYMTIGGIFGPLRVEIQQLNLLAPSNFALSSQSAGSLTADFLGVSLQMGRWLSAGLIAGLVLIFCFKDANFRGSPLHMIAGFGIGGCIIAGWAVTGLSFDEFADQPQAPTSLTFVRATGDTMEYLRRFTANTIPSFAIATVFGALAGAVLGAVSTGRFHLATFVDNKDTLRNLFGAAIMGIGGVFALGCTIGQAITGVSTLALGSFITFAAIVSGAVIGIKSLEKIALAGANQDLPGHR
ncbi:MAG: YeeE/YedE family protein [Proteobacteria bacterium]|nr:YeeE/YedE family protein [Pseudomonadota bacterium]